MKKLILTFVALSALFALAGCSEDTNPVSATGAEKMGPPERETIVDVALAINAETGEFSTLIAAVVGTGLDGALSGNGQKTVFAPTDAAFAALDLNADNVVDALGVEALTEILLYHVANGRRMAEDVVSSDQMRMLNGGFTNIDGAMINSSNIIITDVEAFNGVIHAIDAVLLPTDDDGPGGMEYDEDKMGPPERETIVDVALAINAETGEFSTLIAAVVGTGLDGALSGNGQKTVFAPTDAAFAALDLNADNIVETLGVEALTEILLYHVAKGRRMAEDVVTSDQMRMLNGGFTNIDGAMINSSNIVQTDVEAFNGVIHVIDAVLLPTDDDGPGGMEMTR